MTVEMSKPNNLQRIAQNKALVRTFPRPKKLEKLAVYSSCKVENCKCNGWKNPNPPPTPPRVDVSQPLANLTDPCRSCSHTLDAHVSHLEDTDADELDRLLCIVVDVENLFMCVHKEEDAETKQVYFYLFKLLQKCILNMSNPTIEGPLGSPPFEKPSIAKGVTNFVLYKFGHLAHKEWQTMYDLAKMFLHVLNHWKLETPTSRQQHAGSEDIATYKVNYARWLCYCHVPAICDTLPRYETSLIFGRRLLELVFQTFRRKLFEKIRAEKDRITNEKVKLVLPHFPRFLAMLEEEVYWETSPIWDHEFTHANNHTARLITIVKSLADKTLDELPKYLEQCMKYLNDDMGEHFSKTVESPQEQSCKGPRIEVLRSYCDESKHEHLNVLLVMKHTTTDEHWNFFTKECDYRYKCFEDGFETSCDSFVVYVPAKTPEDPGDVNVSGNKKELTGSCSNDEVIGVLNGPGCTMNIQDLNDAFIMCCSCICCYVLIISSIIQCILPIKQVVSTSDRDSMSVIEQNKEVPVVAVSSSKTAPNSAFASLKRKPSPSPRRFAFKSELSNRKPPSPRQVLFRSKSLEEEPRKGKRTTLDPAETPKHKNKRLSEVCTTSGRNTDPYSTMTSSPALRKSTTDGQKAKVMFTGVVDEQGEKIVKELGGELVTTAAECTHLVTDQVRRTVKFLCCLSLGRPIVSPQWLVSSKNSAFFTDWTPFLIRDEASEKKYKFTLHLSLDKARSKPLLDGYSVHVTKSVKPPPDLMNEILRCAGAKVLSSIPKTHQPLTVVVSCPEDNSVCDAAVKAGIRVVSPEFVLTGVLRQEVDLDAHALVAADQRIKRILLSASTLSEPGGKKRRK